MLDSTVRDGLVERLFAHFIGDQRVKAIWLGGSLGRGTGDEISDIDFYVAVEDAAFETFFNEVPARIDGMQPLVHYTDFAFRRQSPTERVWFFYFQDWPIHWRLDFHVHTTASARGADPDQRRELIYGEWKVLHDPEQLLATLPPVEAPEQEAYRQHVQEKVDHFAWNFALCATYIKRDDFWTAADYLQAIHDRIFYLMAIDSDPAMINDAYPRRFAKICDPVEMEELKQARYGSDRLSMAKSGQRMLNLYEQVARRIAEKVDAVFPEVFVQSVKETYQDMVQRYETL